MRIVFVGAIDFSRHCLEEILKGGGQVVGIFTLEPENGHRHSDYADLGPVAQKYEVPLYRVNNINDTRTMEQIRRLEPDVLFVFGWSQMLSPALLKIASKGCIGTHPALLPKNRGRHPLIWALVEGLEESGLTFFYMDEGADSGDILWQKNFPIALEDDAATLQHKIKVLASQAIGEFLVPLEEGSAPRIPQDHAQATYWRKRTEKDGEIQWGATTLQTYNLVRALARPYVGAHTYLGDKKILVWRAQLPKEPLGNSCRDTTAGTVLESNPEGYYVRTGDGYLLVQELESLGSCRIKGGDHLGRSL